MPNIELGIGRIIFIDIKLALKILKLDVQIMKLSLFHSFIALGKKEYLNAWVLQEYVQWCNLWASEIDYFEIFSCPRENELAW